MTNQPRIDELGQPRELSEIARWVLGISGGTIFAIASIVLIGAWRDKDEFAKASQLVFNALLPLLLAPTPMKPPDRVTPARRATRRQ